MDSWAKDVAPDLHNFLTTQGLVSTAKSLCRELGVRAEALAARAIGPATFEGILKDFLGQKRARSEEHSSSRPSKRVKKELTGGEGEMDVDDEDDEEDSSDEEEEESSSDDDEEEEAKENGDEDHDGEEEDDSDEDDDDDDDDDDDADKRQFDDSALDPAKVFASGVCATALASIQYWHLQRRFRLQRLCSQLLGPSVAYLCLFFIMTLNFRHVHLRFLPDIYSTRAGERVFLYSDASGSCDTPGGSAAQDAASDYGEEVSGIMNHSIMAQKLSSEYFSHEAPRIGALVRNDRMTLNVAGGVTVAIELRSEDNTFASHSSSTSAFDLEPRSTVMYNASARHSLPTLVAETLRTTAPCPTKTEAAVFSSWLVEDPWQADQTLFLMRLILAILFIAWLVPPLGVGVLVDDAQKRLKHSMLLSGRSALDVSLVFLSAVASPLTSSFRPVGMTHTQYWLGNLFQETMILCALWMLLLGMIVLVLQPRGFFPSGASAIGAFLVR